MVEATEGCSINQGKSAGQINSTKFENKFCRLAQQRLKFPKTNEDFSQKYARLKYSNSKLRQLAFKFSCKTARWGRVTFFQEKNSFIALFA
jgi:hypothetical protein